MDSRKDDVNCTISEGQFGQISSVCQHTCSTCMHMQCLESVDGLMCIGSQALLKSILFVAHSVKALLRRPPTMQGQLSQKHCTAFVVPQTFDQICQGTPVLLGSTKQRELDRRDGDGKEPRRAKTRQGSQEFFASHVAVDKILLILAKFTTPAIPADAPLVSQKLCIFAD